MSEVMASLKELLMESMGWKREAPTCKGCVHWQGATMVNESGDVRLCTRNTVQFLTSAGSSCNHWERATQPGAKAAGADSASTSKST